MITSVLFSLLLAQAGRPSRLEVGPPPGNDRGGQVCLFEVRGSGNHSVCVESAATMVASFRLKLPIENAAGVLTNDGAGNTFWAAAAGVVSVTGLGPIAVSSGANPQVSCPTCLRSDANNTPLGGFSLGATTNQWLEMWAGRHAVWGGLCRVAEMSGTSAFGGSVMTFNSSCGQVAAMDGNGFNITAPGSYRANGSTAIDASRNGYFNAVQINGPVSGSGTIPYSMITGAPGGSSYTGQYPIQIAGSLVACPTCLRSDANAVPTGGFNLGQATNQWLEAWAGRHAVWGGACRVAEMSGTSAFGGLITTFNSSCAQVAKMDNNGFDITFPGTYRANGSTVIDTSRNGYFQAITSNSYAYSGQFGWSRSFTIQDGAGNPCVFTFTNGGLTNSTCP
jgi:hypothetical protein